MDGIKESITVLLNNDKVLFFNDRLNSSNMGARDYDKALKVIPELDGLTEGSRLKLKVSNNSLRELGMNARPFKEPVKAFADRKRKW